MPNSEYYGFAVPGDIVCGMSRAIGATAAVARSQARRRSQHGHWCTAGPARIRERRRPLSIFDGSPNRLLPGTRISFRNVTCGTDGTTTVNNFDGAGFVLSPAGSFVLDP